MEDRDPWVIDQEEGNVTDRPLFKLCQSETGTNAASPKADNRPQGTKIQSQNMKLVRKTQRSDGLGRIKEY